MEKLQNEEEGEIKMEDGEIPAGKKRQQESIKEEGEIIENENKRLQLNQKFLKCKFCKFTQPISDTESNFAQTVLCPFARFRRHITRKHMICFICEEHFVYNFDLENHNNTVHQANEGYITCNINRCVYTTKQVSHIFRHALTVHQGIELFKCSQCHNSFETMPALTKHFINHRDRNKLCCQHCSVFHKSTLGCYQTHMIGFHPDLKSNICLKCKKPFDSVQSFFRHLQKHNDDGVKEAEKIQQHKFDVVKEAITYDCTSCDKKFSKKGGLKIHMTQSIIHTGTRPSVSRERKYVCIQCKKDFYTSGHLKSHSFSHTAEKPFNCNQCDRTYKTPCALKVHTFSHSGEKPLTATSVRKLSLI